MSHSPILEGGFFSSNTTWEALESPEGPEICLFQSQTRKTGDLVARWGHMRGRAAELIQPLYPTTNKIHTHTHTHTPLRNRELLWQKEPSCKKSKSG